MGRTLLILLVGFAASFGLLAMGKNRRMLDSVDRMTGEFAGSTAKNVAASGAYMALNRLFLSPSWRDGYNNLVIDGNVLTVTVKNDSLGSSPVPHRVKISSSAGAAGQTQVLVFDAPFNNFAVWAKDTVIKVTTLDSLNNVDANLLIKNAPFMPKIDKTGLTSEASDQESQSGVTHVHTGGGHFHPDDGYPNSSFYYDSTATPKMPNVFHINGDLHLRDNRTVYGIYVVEGNVMIDQNVKIKGVLYMPNTSSRIYNNNASDSIITGGIVTWGEVDGNGYKIYVKHKPQFLRDLVSNYASDNPPIRVLSWK